MGKSRTMIFAAINTIGGILLLAFGFELGDETKAAIVEHVDTIIISMSVLYGIVIGVFRKITDSPLVGWFSKEKK